MKNNNKGFSLVELIVVIAIMAILAAVAIPTFAHFINKANDASDAELLHNINYIFNTACLENGVDIGDVTAANWDKTNKCITGVKVNGVANDTTAKIEASFVLHFGDMTEEEFINITEIIFDAAKHEFVDLATASEITLSYGDKGTITITRDQLNALKESAFGSEMTPGELLGRVDYVTKLAASLMGEGENSFTSLIMGKEYGAILANNLGIDVSTTAGQEELTTVVGQMIEKKMDLLIANGDYPEGADRSEGSALYNAAYHQIVANNAVLHAAQNSQNVSSDILTVLGSGNSTGTILNTINNGESGNGLAQASIAYALYTAYAERNDKTVPENPVDVLRLIDTDEDFRSYINNEDGNGYAQTDLDGYLASMGMINNNVDNNGGAVSDILVNGFANDDLVDMMDQATSN